jgi:hypothetical protein
MTVTLHQTAFAYMQQLILDGMTVYDERGVWTEHRRSSQDENEFIREHGFAECGRWFLGIDDDEPENAKAHYKFPCGDFRKIHRCAILSAESRAGQYKHFEIERGPLICTACLRPTAKRTA